LNDTVELIRREGGEALASPGDVTDVDAARRAVRLAEDAFGPVGILVNNAAVVYVAPVVEADPADWWRVVEVNLRGPFLWMRLVLPGMIDRGSGRIVNISSGIGPNPPAGISSYNASKVALSNLTACVAAEVPQIPIFALGPLALTDMSRSLMEDEGLDPARVAIVRRALRDPDRPLAQTLQMFRFLLSGEADHLSGRHVEFWESIDDLRSEPQAGTLAPGS
jgi:NAD(P)-dependent dehydrogenase (short-subunit alcohol dehydrogenase family)